MPLFKFPSSPIVGAFRLLSVTDLGKNFDAGRKNSSRSLRPVHLV
jgi:hypothetical protein